MTLKKQEYTFTTSFYPPQILNPASTNGDRNLLATPRPSTTTTTTNKNPIFNDALLIREEVFVKEQGCSAEAEVDDDDVRSWGWVVYACPKHHHHHHHQQNQDQEQGSVKAEEAEGRIIPVGVIRLVPPPHISHSHLLLDGQNNGVSATKLEYDYTHEPYIKITRVAVLPSFRGYGISRLLMRTVEKWAQRNSAVIDEMYSLIAAAAAAADDGDIAGAEEERGKGGKWNGLIGLHAQVQVERMYAGFGYETDTAMGRWDEEGIEHVGMFKRVDLKPQEKDRLYELIT